MINKLISLLSVLFLFIQVEGQSHISPETIRGKMQWFADAKLGIFIHWGIYAVDGIDESWSFFNHKISWPDYMKQLNGFTARNYQPEAWADLIKKSGARYSVITTKHHDGVALWKTLAKTYNVVDNTPAKRDLLAPFFKALRERGIKCGAYFSLLDWSYPDYTGFLRDSSRYKIADDPARWEKFRRFFQSQINEINSNYHPDLFWFDGDWEHSAEEWQAPEVREMILSANPNAILNSRLQGYGDYDTPEQNFPVTRPRYEWWELCMTINNNWGYQPQDTAWKTPYEIITIFADVIGNGGNLLLDIGPKQDGTIPPEQVHVLEELGKWTHKNSEGIFGTLGGMPPGHFYGPSTLSKDSSNLFLFIPGKQTGEIVIKGLDNQIRDISVLGTDAQLKFKIVGKISWSPVPGLVYVQVPEAIQDPYMTVLRIRLDKPVKLYSGEK